MRKTKLTSKILTFLLVFSLVFSGLPAFALDGETYEKGASSQNGYYGYDVDYKEEDNKSGQDKKDNLYTEHDKDNGKNENFGDEYDQEGNGNLNYGYDQDKNKDNNLDNGYDGYDKYLDEDYEKDIDENYDYDKYCVVCEYCECEYCKCAFAKIAPMFGTVTWEEAKNSALLTILGGMHNLTFRDAWEIMALARSNLSVPAEIFDLYYEAVINHMNGQPDSARVGINAMDNSRVVIALSSIGRDATNIGGQFNLVGTGGLADLHWITTLSVNNPIYALIAIDTKEFDLPTPAQGVTTRQALLDNILNQEVSNAGTPLGTPGGWALTGNVMCPDITGMALTALAPYRSQPAVGAAIDRALHILSETQLPSGEWESLLAGGSRNSQSAAQVIVALSALGIDAQTDSRFQVGFNNPLTALLSYYNDGGFRNLWNDTNINAMATTQAAYALVAYYRFINNMNPLYDMSDADGGNIGIVSKFVLYREIARAQNLTEADFTPESWAVMQEALEAAIIVRDNVNATQIEVNAVTETLRNARNALSSYNIAVFISFDGASLGHGFYIEPVRLIVPNGTSAGEITLELLHARGHVYELSWWGMSYFLERIHNFNPGIANPPQEIKERLEAHPLAGAWNPNPRADGSLGEGDYFPNSMWLISVNNSLDNAGASDTILNNGDVVRWHFSLDWSNDLGTEGWGITRIFEAVDKSDLIRELFAPGVNQGAIQQALDTILNPLATANDVRLAIQALRERPVVAGQRAFISVTDPFSGPGQTRTFFPGTWIDIGENETVYTLLRRTGLDIETRFYAGGNIYVVNINGWGEFSDGPLSGWVYSVNGVPGERASGHFPVNNGDRVEWLFTRNLGYDVFGDQGFGAPGSAQEEDEIVNLDIEVAANVTNGVATAEITTNMVRDAIAQLADADEEITGLKFIIAKEEDVSRVEAFLTVGTIREMIQNDLALTIMSDLVTRTFDLETLLGLADGELNPTRVAVIVEIIDATYANIELHENVFDEIINLKVKIGNTVVSEFAGLVRVTVPFVRPIIMPISDTDLLTVYNIDENENLREMSGAQYRAAAMTFSSNHLGSFVISEWINPFDDVLRHDWHLRNVRFVYAHGLMSGVATGEFAPEQDLTRAMIATILWRLAGEPDAAGSGVLTDVQAGRWYESPANWANAQGIMNTEGGIFSANESITYGQIIEILINFANTQELRIVAGENQLRQVTSSELTTLFNSAGALQRLSANNILNRAQVAAIMQLFIENTTEVK